MNEYRCTRNHPYRSPGCIGNKDKTARQGHYIRAHTIDEANQVMKTRYPDEIEDGFTVTFWKEVYPL